MVNNGTKYLKLFEAAPIGISIVDADRNIIEANKTLEKVSRLSRKELMDASYKTRKYFNPDGNEILPDEFPSSIALRENRIVKDVEIGIIEKNSQVFWTRVSAAPLDDNGEYAVVTTEDITEKKNLEIRLKASEEKYRSVFENCMNAVLLTGTEGEIYAANRTACLMFGRSEEELCKVGRNGLVDISDPRVGLALKERKKKGAAIREIMLLRKNGTKFPAEISSSVFMNSDGIMMTSMIIRDISKSKLAENTCDLQSEILKNITEGINLVRFSDEKIIFTNPRFDEMFGYKRGELIGKNISIVNAPTDKSPEVIKTDIKTYIKLNGEWQGEILNIRKNGDQFWCSAHVSMFDHPDYGNVFISTHSDITEKKKAEDALLESEERHRLLMENSGLGIAYYSVDGKILMLNKVACNNLGGYPSDFIGKNLTEIFGKEKGKIFIDRLTKVAASENPVVFEDKIELDGNPGWYLSTQSRILNKNGEVDGIQVIANNITVSKTADTNLKKSNKRYQNLSRKLNQILENERARLALNLHDDLGQKLTALNLDVAWVKRRVGVNPSLVKMKLDEMRLLLNDTIESIKEISFNLRPSILFDLGLYPAISSLLVKFEKQSGIRCTFKYGPEETGIDDRISIIIYRVLQESLTNISRHSGASAVEITFSLSMNKLVMVIKDNGRGINDEQINSITSLGIAGINERVNSVHGKAKIVGNAGSGTMIMVSIPLNQPQND